MGLDPAQAACDLEGGAGEGGPAISPRRGAAPLADLLAHAELPRVVVVRRPRPGWRWTGTAGDSLIATQLNPRLYTTFGLRIPVEKLFEQPTVAGQAQTVAAAQAEREAEQQGKVLSLLAEMSDEEAEVRLREMMQGGPAHRTPVSPGEAALAAHRLHWGGERIRSNLCAARYHLTVGLAGGGRPAAAYRQVKLLEPPDCQLEARHRAVARGLVARSFAEYYLGAADWLAVNTAGAVEMFEEAYRFGEEHAPGGRGLRPRHRRHGARLSPDGGT